MEQTLPAFGVTRFTSPSASACFLSPFPGSCATCATFHGGIVWKLPTQCKLGIKRKFHQIHLWKRLFTSAKISLQITHSDWSNLVTQWKLHDFTLLNLSLTHNLRGRRKKGKRGRGEGRGRKARKRGKGKGAPALRVGVFVFRAPRWCAHYDR